MSFKGNQNNLQSPGNNLFNMFLNKDDENYIAPNVSLSSWAGSPEVIEECKEVISYIENKELFNKMGAEMPKGILLEGPPGTGKTLLAKAIAGETNSTFIAISGSEFVELFVGMGASRVRDLFQNARNNNPCIIFIDEIDAVARQRGAGINMANDEREQTLNQLLYEMDGFNSNENIVVIAATNRRDVLDQAILRPGRFDRIIRVSLPDKDSREKIIEYYLNNKNIERNFDISSIADLTEGFSGAQIKNLINEAIILSARNKYTKLQEEYIFESFEKSVVGLIRKNATVDIVTQKRVAIHESGHSILTLLFNDTFDFKKASIQPTYNGAGGYTFFSEKPEIRNGGLYTKDMLKKRLIVSMGGKAAESLFYGNEYISLGAVEDLRQANKLAKRMIGNFGMGDELEVFFNEDVSDDSNPFLGRSLSIGDKYSEHTKFMMDKESLELVKNAYYTAFDLLEKHYDKLIHFSDLLLNNTVIYRDNVDFF
jgi:cell division protease FtsH